MARRKKVGKERKAGKRPIEPYEHKDKERVNNPPVGLVTPQTDPDAPSRKLYAYHQPVPLVPSGGYIFALVSTFQ